MNTKLITYLVGKGGSISAEKNTKGDNPLHLLAQMCMKHDMASLVKSLNTEVWVFFMWSVYFSTNFDAFVFFMFLIKSVVCSKTILFYVSYCFQDNYVRINNVKKLEHFKWVSGRRTCGQKFIYLEHSATHAVFIKFHLWNILSSIINCYISVLFLHHDL